MTLWNQCPLWLLRMQHLQSLTLHWCSFPGWVRERWSTYYDHKCGWYIQKEQQPTIVNISWFTLGYSNVTINRTTGNAQREIGPDRSIQTRWNPRVNGYVARFGLQRSSGSGVWTVQEPNWTVFPVQTRTAGVLPRPVANTSYPVPNRCRSVQLQSTSWMLEVRWFHA